MRRVEMHDVVEFRSGPREGEQAFVLIRHITTGRASFEVVTTDGQAWFCRAHHLKKVRRGVMALDCAPDNGKETIPYGDYYGEVS